jgi:galactokinase
MHSAVLTVIMDENPPFPPMMKNTPSPTPLSHNNLHASAPGRVNLLGEHVDYNGGPVLPAAIDRAVHLSFAPRTDRRVVLEAVDLGRTATFDLAHLPAKQDTSGEPLPVWAQYPAGVAWALQNDGYEVRGMEASFTSDVPIGAGLSSSAAVEMAFSVAWRELGGWQADNLTLARLSQRAENGYVGVNCGLMDQFACAMGVKDHALYFDTRSLAWEPLPLPAGSAIVVADSGVRRSLANSAYNERRADCERAVAILGEFLPGIQTLRDVSPAQFDAYAGRLPEPVRRHARHVVEECARVDEAIPLLKAGNAAGFGQLMVACHASLRDLYEVSVPELDRLVEIAMSLPGCWGARLTGAGFGGCTVNLVKEELSEPFIAGLKSGYAQSTGRQAQVYLCHASQGAHIEDGD